MHELKASALSARDRYEGKCIILPSTITTLPECTNKTLNAHKTGI